MSDHTPRLPGGAGAQHPDRRWMPPAEGQPSADPPVLDSHAETRSASRPLPPVEPDVSIEAPVGPATAQPSSRPRWLVGAAVLSVLAVGVAGIFAIINLTDRAAGGGGTPTELADAMFDVVDDDDVLGMLDLLLPDERDALGAPFVELYSELTRLEVLAESSLADLSGVDFQVTDRSIEVHATNVDDIVNIEMGADLVITVDGAELPIGDLLLDHVPDEVMTDLRGSRQTDTGRFDMTLAAVAHQGQWYFSLLYTAAELARAELAPGIGVPFEGVGATGADDPGAAVDLLVDSILELDLTSSIQALDPGEAGALQRYAPLFVDDAQSELDAALAEVDFQIAATDRMMRVDVDGDRATVFVDALAIEGSVDGEAFSAAIDGECVRAEGMGESFEQCVSADDARDELDELLIDYPATIGLVDVLTRAFDDMGETGIEVRRVDGEWFVSPTTTITEATFTMTRALDRADLDEIIDAAAPVFDELGEAFIDPYGSFAPGDLFDDTGDATSLETVPVETPSIGDVPDGGAGGTDVWSLCWNQPSFDEATRCFDDAVATGDLTEFDVPSSFDHSECGWSEISWSGELYELDDDEFIAAIVEIRPCYVDVYQRGEIEEWELPWEFSHPHCFEGRNWYTVYDDPEYDDRFWECVDGPLDPAFAAGG